MSANTDQDNRVVITGIGLITPFGVSREISWNRLQNGERAIRSLNAEDGFHISASHNGSRADFPAGAPAPIFQIHETGQASDEQTEPVIKLALQAAEEAIQDAGIEFTPENRDRAGCVVGTSKGGLRSISKALRLRHANASADFAAQLWTQFFPHAPSAAVAGRYGLGGPLLSPVAACATGLVSLIRGYELLRNDHCDVVLAGSSDASLEETVLASFKRMRVLASRYEDPSRACRPFDRNRNGFLVGEGAAILVMERLEHARKRKARLYAEFVSGGMLSDVSGITKLDTSAHGISRLIRDVLQRAELTAREIDYINMHGTATTLNDLCETRAIKTAFGPSARTRHCSSLKGAMGHLLGAAGSVETAATILAMRDSVIPPTVNLKEPDEDCDLNYTPEKPESRRIEHALKLSLGFGGHLAAAVLRRMN